MAWWWHWRATGRIGTQKLQLHSSSGSLGCMLSSWQSLLSSLPHSKWRCLSRSCGRCEAGHWLCGKCACAVAASGVPCKPCLSGCVPPPRVQVASWLQVEKLDASLAGAYEEWAQLDANLYHSKVWFWRWREPYRTKVLEKQPAVDAARARFDVIAKQQEQIFSDAKSQLGLWSEAGVGESRDLFW